jgi:hypothetical protein
MYQCFGTGSGIQDGKKSGSGFGIRDKHPRFSESLETVFRIKNTYIV